MKIIRAEHLGMCFGVRDAITLARRESSDKPLTILGDLVHNETVLEGLRKRGITIQQDVTTVATQDVMITAHGASQQVIDAVKQRGLNVIEATCPLVRVAHDAVKELVEDGYHPVIIGKRDHVEVRGLTGDLKEFDVVLTEQDVKALGSRSRFGITAQTTQPIDKVQCLVRLMQMTFPDSEIRFIDTVCNPTKQRQRAAVEMAGKCDVVVVIGGENSNNTRELVNTCGKHCSHVHHVQTVKDLKMEWFDDAENIGITAGTSTPDESLDSVELGIWRLCGNRKREIAKAKKTTMEETV